MKRKEFLKRLSLAAATPLLLSCSEDDEIVPNDDSDGLASFTSIFPGWYSGRATHIHVHIYDASGKSLLVTQIAFPSEITDSVYTSAMNYYTKGKQDTSNDNDNVFGDGYAQELATITGNISEGFELTHAIVVEA